MHVVRIPAAASGDGGANGSGASIAIDTRVTTESTVIWWAILQELQVKTNLFCSSKRLSDMQSG